MIEVSHAKRYVAFCNFCWNVLVTIIGIAMIPGPILLIGLSFIPSLNENTHYAMLIFGVLFEGCLIIGLIGSYLISKYQQSLEVIEKEKEMLKLQAVNEVSKEQDTKQEDTKQEDTKQETV